MVNITLLPWVILFSPLLAAFFIALFFLRSPKIAGILSTASVLISFAASAALFGFYLKNPSLLPVETAYAWISIPGLSIPFGFLIDRLSLLMLLIVTGVGSCIFLYSIGYMRGDQSFPRYFASLSLFAFSMLGIVLAHNFLMLFVFWELVAVSSYLLIGFWFEKPSAADAGNKAFIINRVGDFGFVIGIFMVWMLSGLGGAERTFLFSELATRIPDLAHQNLVTPAILTVAAFLVFCGVVGKSAQFPLYIWLPDAMEGPTPVSALIHAATMVAAGVYLLARTFFLIHDLPNVLETIAVIGVITAGMAALLAVVQNDIKKILAYSTISQLGYMVMAVGLGSSTIGMYHLTTHAFFKALLFLGAGAMIHSLHTQNIWEMGSLLKRMPVTAATFLIGTLALCGIYPFSGFFSKDEILALAYEENRVIYFAALLTAGLTAFYMTRAVWIAILGPDRKTHGHDHHAVHDAEPIMKWPLIVLAFFSVTAGFMGIPAFIMGGHGEHPHFNMAVAITSTGVALAGIALGTLLYARVKNRQDPLERFFGKAYDVLVKKYYLDEAFLALANFFQKLIAQILFIFDSKVIIDRGANGAAQLTAGLGSFIRYAQTGKLQTTALVFSFGLVALVAFMFLRGF
ncbi:MAG: NADH-quinone oxidoreductase subunit L [Candidatus Omnitrophica bacterium]|nr:NADH-quinone oxidoreductase subunit L [Candidatus Omnitrophota bacterium]